MKKKRKTDAEILLDARDTIKNIESSHVNFIQDSASQHRMRPTIFGVGLAMFILGYIAGVEHVIHRIFGGW